MTLEEKKDFLGNISYFWHEKGNVERFSGYSEAKFEEADSDVARAYQEMVYHQQVFESLLKHRLEEK